MPSLPHIAMTVGCCGRSGSGVDDSHAERLDGRAGAGRRRTTVIEPDLSNAAPFLAAAAGHRRRGHRAALAGRTTQAGDAIRGILAAMGAGVSLAETV